MESIMVLGRRIEIHYVDDEALAPEELGDFRLHLGVIRVRRSLPPDKLASVLLHEILHAVLGVAGWSASLTDDVEEGIVSALEHGLIDHIDIYVEEE